MRLLNQAKMFGSRITTFEPVRPTVLIQSDDWGRVGLPNLKAIESLRTKGVKIGQSPWDYYGAESSEDLQKLGETLSSVRDRDGRPACMTANIVMANADIRRMRSEDFTTYRTVPLHDGFPAPWIKWDVIGAYHRLIREGVWYPALHGFTHFSPDVMLQAWHDEGEFGERARLLLEHDIPYLASLTPEFNFALLRRYVDGERFASMEEQRRWIEAGVNLFLKCFGFIPVSACAPGYRANDVTFRLWTEYGIRVGQTASGAFTSKKNNLLLIHRNVFFEPALSDDMDVSVQSALSQAENAVRQGKIIVICSHSINYIDQFLGRRESSLQALDDLLNALVHRWPDLRFAHDADVNEAWNGRNKDWFVPPSLSMIRSRWHD